MQIRNPVVCDTGLSSLYLSNKPLLVVEHAFPLMGFCSLIGSRYIWWQQWDNVMSTARPKLPYSCISRQSLASRLLVVESNVMVVVMFMISWFNVLAVRLDVICKLETL